MTSDRTNRRDSWLRSAPVLAIAVLALLMSVAGGAYAAVANNSVGSAQLKSNAVTSSKIAYGGVESSDIESSTIETSDVKNGSLTTSDVKDGSLDLDDITSTERPLRTYAGYVSADGSLHSGSPGVDHAVKQSTGYYSVYFNGISIDGCVVVTTANGGTINTSSALGSSTTFYVFARNILGTGAPYVDTDFSFVVMCY